LEGQLIPPDMNKIIIMNKLLSLYRNEWKRKNILCEKKL